VRHKRAEVEDPVTGERLIVPVTELEPHAGAGGVSGEAA
jgi:hypothetical protein